MCCPPSLPLSVQSVCDRVSHVLQSPPPPAPPPPPFASMSRPPPAVPDSWDCSRCPDRQWSPRVQTDSGLPVSRQISGVGNCRPVRAAGSVGPWLLANGYYRPPGCQGDCDYCLWLFHCWLLLLQSLNKTRKCNHGNILTGVDTIERPLKCNIYIINMEDVYNHTHAVQSE